MCNEIRKLHYKHAYLKLELLLLKAVNADQVTYLRRSIDTNKEVPHFTVSFSAFMGKGDKPQFYVKLKFAINALYFNCHAIFRKFYTGRNYFNVYGI